MIQKRENLHAGRQPFNKSGESCKTVIRRIGHRQLIQNIGHHAGQQGAGAFTAGCGNATGHPSRQGAADIVRTGKALRSQPVPHLVFVFQRWGCIAGCGIIGKQVMRAVQGHLVQRLLQGVQKGLCIGMPQKGSEIGDIFMTAGQGMCLGIGHHLQPVFNPAKMVIMR